MFWNADTFHADQVSQVKITNNGLYTAAAVRMDGSTDRFYMAMALGGAGHIYARFDGSYFDLASTFLGFSNGDFLACAIVGTTHPFTVRLYRNGSLSLEWTSTSSAQEKPGGNPGISIYSPSGQNLSVDDFKGVGIDYSLALAEGSFALTGEPTGLPIARKIAPGQGSFVLTGEPMNPTAQRQIAPGQGSFALTGEQVGLSPQYQMLAEQGMFDLTGENISLQTLLRLQAIQGAYSLSGFDAQLIQGSSVSNPLYLDAFLSKYTKSEGVPR